MTPNGAKYRVRRISVERGSMEIVRDLTLAAAVRIVDRDTSNGTAVSTYELDVRDSGRVVLG